VLRAGGIEEYHELALAVLIGLGTRDVEYFAVGMSGQVLDADADEI
jgi:hypothetical protein